MKLNFTHKGQGMVEAIVTLPLVLLVGSAFILMIYRGMVFYFADYQLHEALLCTESVPPKTCKDELQNRLNKILITKPTTRISLNKNRGNTTGQISINLRPPLHIEQKLKRSAL